ncbi:uncharacterized protein LOC128392149 isoform X2 [Panonychus citri]|nr:uncharacterized protein LOC128392149 isoform X2 [Panonychus citri]
MLIEGKSFSLMCFIFTIELVHSLKFIQFEVPKSAPEGSDVQLICSYDLEGYPLYQLKWYYNGSEFFRHEPKVKEEPFLYLKVNGIKINKKRSNSTHLILSDVSKSVEGPFACEVSTDSLFQTKYLEANLTISGSRSSGSQKFGFTIYAQWKIIISLIILQSMISHQVITNHLNHNRYPIN